MTRGDYKYSTVSSYVSAIISRNKLYGFGLSPHDDFLVNMAKRSASELCDHTVEKKLPLSRQQVQQLGFLDPAGSNTIVSASLTGIFGLLRSDEIISLNFEDLSICYRLGKRVARLIIRQSKVDQAGRGESVLISCVRNAPDDDICSPFCAFHRLLLLAALQRPASSPLFEFRNSRLSHDSFMFEFRHLLTHLGIPAEALGEYGLHSLRRTGATLCYISAVRDHTIREQGRWSSECVYEYLVDASLAERVTLAEKMMNQ